MENADADRLKEMGDIAFKTMEMWQKTVHNAGVELMNGMMQMQQDLHKIFSNTVEEAENIQKEFRESWKSEK